MVDELTTPGSSDVPATPVAPASPGPQAASAASSGQCAPCVQAGGKIKEPVLSALLSFLLSGLGQIYNGQVKKGLVFLVLDFLLAFGVVFLIFGGSIFMGLITFWAGGLGMCCCFPFVFLPFVWKVYFMYDAYRVAEQINRSETVIDWFS
jgi:TM2 domain-containing membrane protein YozV